MAYAALRSLAQILHQTLNRDHQYLILDEKQQIESLVEIITSIQKDFSSQKKTQVDEEREIRDSAYIVEDIIESRIIERFRTESAGNEDGSTEKKLIRFDVIETLIDTLSYASIGSGLEIVGVGGIETFQILYGIRQLARNFRFKAWFLHSNVLHGNSAPYLNAIWTLERLANHGTEIVIIDPYSMRTSAATMEELRSFGFDTSLFVGAITTENFRALVPNRADDAWFEEPGPSNIDITSGAELKVTKKTFFTGLKLRKKKLQISRVKKNFTLKIKWAWRKKPSPAPSPRPCATWFDRDATEEYKSPMAMAGVDAANRRILVLTEGWEYKSHTAMVTVDVTDRCIVVTSDFHDIKAANAAGISSIFLTDYGHREFADAITHVRDLAARHDAHPTYVLLSFTW